MTLFFVAREGLEPSASGLWTLTAIF